MDDENAEAGEQGDGMESDTLKIIINNDSAGDMFMDEGCAIVTNGVGIVGDGNI